MRRICAWCHKALDEELVDGGPISHGICTPCLDYVLADRTAIRGLLSTLEGPVLAVDGEGRIISANWLARQALGKEHSQIENRLGGAVIECQYSHLPEGCGKTIHCTGCQIRGSVNFTRETGKACQRVKAQQGIMTPTGVKTFCYYVSTEKLADETVLLRIEEVREVKNTEAECDSAAVG